MKISVSGSMPAVREREREIERESGDKDNGSINCVCNKELEHEIGSPEVTLSG